MKSRPLNLYREVINNLNIFLFLSLTKIKDKGMVRINTGRKLCLIDFVFCPLQRAGNFEDSEGIIILCSIWLCKLHHRNFNFRIMFIWYR